MNMAEDSSVVSSKEARAELVTLTICLMDCKRGSSVDLFGEAATSLVGALDAPAEPGDPFSDMVAGTMKRDGKKGEGRIGRRERNGRARVEEEAATRRTPRKAEIGWNWK